ncbi:MAG: GNAT family N-acetyltransferase [Dehalococcoidia bacterium]
MGLINQAGEPEGSGRPITPQHLREWLGQPHSHPEQDIFLAEMAERLVGYATTFRELEIGRVILGGCVHPAQRRRGIGSRLLKTSLNHAQELGAAVAHIRVPERMKATLSFVQRHGFEVVHREWEMRLERSAEPLPVKLPPGFQHLPFRPGDEEKLTEIQNLAFAESRWFRPNSVEEIRYWARMTSPGSRGIILITQSDQVVGYCWTGFYRDELIPLHQAGGRIFMMGVHPQYRGRGLGGAALALGVNYLAGQGIGAVELTVDSQNLRAKKLYQSAGFQKKGVTLWYERALGSGPLD